MGGMAGAFHCVICRVNRRICDSNEPVEDIRELTTDEYNRTVWNGMSERTWGLQFERLCRAHGWTYYHTFNSQHSAGGYPDYIVVRPPVLFFAELKTEKGKLTKKQEHL